MSSSSVLIREKPVKPKTAAPAPAASGRRSSRGPRSLRARARSPASATTSTIDPLRGSIVLDTPACEQTTS